MNKKVLSTVLSLLLLLSLTACGSTVSVPELLTPIETEDAVATAACGDLARTTILTGSAVPETMSLQLDYENDAYDIAFAEGDSVEEGDVLLKLNDSLEKSIAELKVELSVTETEYKVELTRHETEIAELEQQKKSLKAVGNTYEAELTALAISEKETEFSYSHYETENRISEIKEEIASMEEQLSESVVEAPCSGVILDLLVSEDGDTIPANTDYVTIAVDGTLRLACPYISEEDFNEMQSVTATVNGKEYEISYIPFTEEELFYLELESGTKYCYFSVAESSGIEYGDSVIFTFTSAVTDVLKIPSEALYTSHGTYYVDVVTEDGTEARAVTIGSSSLNETEITSGLTEGEVVFVAKDYARYSVNYETTQAYTGSIDLSEKISGVTRVSDKLYDFTNPVPGEITEIYISTFAEVFVEKGQELYKISPSISDSEWEQTKVDLKNYQKSYDENCTSYSERISESEEALKDITDENEKILAEYSLKELKEEYESYKEEGGEEIARLTERIENFEKWSEGEVVVYAEDDGIIESFSSLSVGKTLSENEVICGFYEADNFTLTMNDSEGKLRYGMEVTYQSRPETDLVEFPAVITKTSLVGGSGNTVEAELNDPDNYLLTDDSGYFVYSDSIDNVLLLPNAYVQYTETEEEAETEDAGSAIVPLNRTGEESSEEESTRPYVYVYDDNHCIVKRYISIVGLYDGICWIADGITADDVVVKP